ncbi:MAG: hydroxymethylbilane synthase, partial [Saprospiraceae bacterium]|nr:hydroxymethylbilane synthase [Saprospiraceae bacterium]
FIPAPAQGVLAYQIRQADTSTLQMVRDHLHHAPTARLTNIERKVLKLMQGGCHLPLGAYCETDKLGYFHLYTTYAKELSEPLRHYNLSYSTTDGLAEAIVEYYLNQ